ncbi:MAG TPA: RodZ domain-containing protein [Stellaceae bacterium]|nr:RodZ domain-containing protein [Stellaceae bacterium]
MGFLSRFSHDDIDDTEFEDEFDLSNAALKRSHSVGALLRQARQGFGREVGQIGAALRIRSAHLQAIEDGRYEDLPGGTYAIGFIRTYAEYLGLDGPEMVRRFKQEIEGQEFKNDLSFPMPVSERKLSGSTMLLGGVMIAVCGYGIWYYLSSGDHGRTEQVAAVPTALLAPPSDAAIATPPSDAVAAASVPPATAPATVVTAASAATAAQPAAQAAQPARTASESAVSQAILLAQAQARTPPPQPRGLPPPAPDSQMASLPPAAMTPVAAPVDPAHLFGETKGSYRIALRATADCWLEVRDGDTMYFKRMLRPGDVFRLPDKSGLSMRVGNAKGIEVSVDGKVLPSAQVVDLLRKTVAVDPREILTAAAAPKGVQ